MSGVFFKSCWMCLIASLQSSGTIRCPSCSQLCSILSSYSNATEFVDQAAVGQGRYQSNNAKICKAQKIVITASKRLSNCVLRLVRNRFLSLVLIATTVLVRLPFSYRVMETLEGCIEREYGSRHSNIGKAAPTESPSNVPITPIKPGV